LSALTLFKPKSDKALAITSDVVVDDVTLITLKPS
jgi:hypothetical protein